MSWWGNSFEKAVGLSSYASTALKNAQKKIDKVLDIPVIDDETGINSTEISNNAEIESDSQLILTDQPSLSINTSDIPKNKVEDKEFSDVDLTSPAKHINDLTTNFPLQIDRVGDWNIDDSLTVSQFDRFTDLTRNQSFEVGLVREEEIENEENEIDDENNCKNKPEMIAARNSHLSLSSDVTVKKVGTTDDMDSSGHLDDESDAQKEEEIQESTTFLEFHKPESPNSKDEQDSQTTTSSDIELVSNIPQTDNEITKSINRISYSLSYQDNSVDQTKIENSSPPPMQPSSSLSSSPQPVIASSSLHQPIKQELQHHSRSMSSSSMSICKVEDMMLSPHDLSNVPHDYDYYHLKQQYNDLMKRMEMKESKMIQINRENMDLRDTINSLKRQIEQMNEQQDINSTDISALTREFTIRLNEAEKRAQNAIKEKDQYKKIINDIKSDESQKIENVIKDKEQQVAELLMEGEKLAQEMLKANNAAKKLKEKMKEKDGELNSLVTKLTKAEAEQVHLKKVLDNREENERKHIDGINQLTRAVEKLEKENIAYKRANETLQETNESIDNAFKKLTQEMTTIKRQLSKLENENETLKEENSHLTNQQTNKTDKIQTFEMKLKQKNEELLSYQTELSNLTRNYNHREEKYNSTIQDLQNKFAEMQQNHDDINEAISQATRPLMKQLDVLQTACSSHSNNWEMAEHGLNGRIRDLQQKLEISEESVNQYKLEMRNQDDIIATMREQNDDLNRKNKQILLEKSELVQDKSKLQNEIKQVSNSYMSEIERLKEKIKFLECRINEVNYNLDLEKQNSLNLNVRLTNAQMTISQNETNRNRTDSSNSTMTEVDPDDSVSLQSHKSTHAFNRYDHTNNHINNTSLYDNIRQQGVAVITESLQASLKQKDGQISKLQSELISMSDSREEMLQEMTELNQKIEELNDKVDEYRKSREQYLELTERYNALLQMYGEKMDECDELKLDLSEIKDVYKSHIDMLSKKSE